MEGLKMADLFAGLLGAMTGGGNAVADIKADDRKQLAEKLKMEAEHKLSMIRQGSSQEFQAGENQKTREQAHTLFDEGAKNTESLLDKRLSSAEKRDKEKYDFLGKKLDAQAQGESGTLTDVQKANLRAIDSETKDIRSQLSPEKAVDPETVKILQNKLSYLESQRQKILGGASSYLPYNDRLNQLAESVEGVTSGKPKSSPSRDPKDVVPKTPTQKHIMQGVGNSSDKKNDLFYTLSPDHPDVVQTQNYKKIGDAAVKKVGSVVGGVIDKIATPDVTDKEKQIVKIMKERNINYPEAEKIYNSLKK
jgi:hypothetical protein